MAAAAASASASASAASAVQAFSSVQFSKVYWMGRHTVAPELGSPVSKVHREGLQLLRSLGWTQVQNDTACIPVFAFTTRKGADYPADRPGLPAVRQLPHAHTACLDDKRSMTQYLTAAGLQHLIPSSWDSIEAYQAFAAAQQQEQLQQQSMEQLQQPQQMGAAELREQQQHQQQHQQQQQQADDALHARLPQLQLYDHAQLPDCATTAAAEAGAAASHNSAAAGSASHSNHKAPLLPSGAVPALVSGSDMMQAVADVTASSSSSSSSSKGAMLPGGSVYVKHKLGVKGQAVYVARTAQQLLQLQHRLKASSKDFVVQQEVQPLLLQGRKFVMRVHVLVVPQRQQQQQQHGVEAGVKPTRAAVRVYVHRDVIVLQHSEQYDHASDDSAVHISSRGKQHLTPALLGQSQLPTCLQDSIWQQLQRLAAQCIAAVCHVLLPTAVHPDAVLYHLLGFDCMVDATGKVRLLEVNSYPAIASGTMSAVDDSVYTRLVGDLVRLLVLPVADEVTPEPGGFVDVTHLL